jgi:hypothetical protein
MKDAQVETTRRALLSGVAVAIPTPILTTAAFGGAPDSTLALISAHRLARAEQKPRKVSQRKFCQNFAGGRAHASARGGGDNPPFAEQSPAQPIFAVTEDEIDEHVRRLIAERPQRLAFIRCGSEAV